MSFLAQPNLVERVALGLVPGWQQFRKFGMNNAVGVGTEEMWPLGTARTLPTTAAVAIATSASAADDGNPAGTGARSIVIEGLDANYNEISETLTLEGLSNATTTASFFRINRAYVYEAGSGKINAGAITITVGGNAQAYIEATQGQTHQTHYTVPNGKTLLVTGLNVGTGRMSGNTDLHVLSQIRLDGTVGSDAAWRSISDIFLWNGASHTNTDTATLIPSKTEVRQRIVSTVATQAHSIYTGFLIVNDRYDY